MTIAFFRLLRCRLHRPSYTHFLLRLPDKLKNKRKRADEPSLTKKGKGTRVEVEYENEDEDEYEAMKEIESQKVTAAMDFNF